MSARRTFGASWWGDAWVRALEDRARLDANRLPRGRTYARQDRVPALVLDHGEIRAAVEGSRPAPYRVTVRLRTFSDEEWDRLFETIASKAGHAAALLDGDLDPAIDLDAREVGIELLPSAGDIQARCTCPDRANPCKHAAAVCYLVADRLDDDPFDLFHLRGRSRDDVRNELRRRRRGGAPTDRKASTDDTRPPSDELESATDRAETEAATDTTDGADDGADPGVRASAAWKAAPESPPPPPAIRARPGRPAPFPLDPPPSAPFDADGLRLLAADAARRAWALMAGVGDADLDLDARYDLARRAADALGTEDWDHLVTATAERPARLTSLALAWRQAGATGVDISDEPPWAAPAVRLVEGRDALSAVLPGLVTVSNNRVTDAGRTVQLRYGGDGRWYRFDKRGTRWELAAPAADDPADLL